MQVYGGIGSRSMSDIPSQARKVEETGYDGISLGEITQDPFLGITLAAEHTQRVKLSTSVVIAFPRSPMITAGISWTLQQFSKGRFQLGLGSQVKGHNERRFSVPWSPPGPRMREYILALRAIWDCWQNGTKLDFQGHHYTFTLMTPEFNPGPIDYPMPQVFIAAINPYMCRLAGEICNGVLLHGMNSPKYVQEVILPNIEEGAKKAGRTLKDIEIGGGGFIVTGENEEELQRSYETARRRISFYGSTRTYLPTLDIYGWGAVGQQLHEMSLKGLWNEMPRLVTDEMMEAFCTIGTYDDIAEKIKATYGGWATRIAFAQPEGDPDKQAKIRGIVRDLQG